VRSFRALDAARQCAIYSSSSCQSQGHKPPNIDHAPNFHRLVSMKGCRRPYRSDTPINKCIGYDTRRLCARRPQTAFGKKRYAAGLEPETVLRNKNLAIANRSRVMSVSVAVCEIFSVKKWCDLENRGRVRSRSLEMAPFDRSHTSSYSPSMVTMAIYCIVCEM